MDIIETTLILQELEERFSFDMGYLDNFRSVEELYNHSVEGSVRDTCQAMECFCAFAGNRKALKYDVIKDWAVHNKQTAIIDYLNINSTYPIQHVALVIASHAVDFYNGIEERFKELCREAWTLYMELDSTIYEDNNWHEIYETTDIEEDFQHQVPTTPESEIEYEEIPTKKIHFNE